jgi:hypothetical protein
MNRARALGVAVIAVLPASLLLGDASNAYAEESIIKQPGEHPKYVFEAEPHLVLAFGGPWYGCPGCGTGWFGLGFRGTINITDGFVKSINDSVGIGFGADFGGFGDYYTWVVIPVVMQWNFWLSTHWSVFGEPGLSFVPNYGPWHGGFVWPTFYVGGRYQFSEAVSLTMRLGFPEGASVGVSFFL